MNAIKSAQSISLNTLMSMSFLNQRHATVSIRSQPERFVSSDSKDFFIANPAMLLVKYALARGTVNAQNALQTTTCTAADAILHAQTRIS